MWEIRYVQPQDRDFWFRLDRHLPEAEFERKVREKQGYLLLEDQLLTLKDLAGNAVRKLDLAGQN